jgi:hypothetical protein
MTFPFSEKSRAYWFGGNAAEGETLACSNWLICRKNVEIVHSKPLLLARFGKRPQ